MKHLVIGLGEIGQALKKILSADGHDPIKGEVQEGQYDVLHICIPYIKDFESIVTEYKEKFKPSMVIIHATMPVGVSDSLSAVHSPVRGVHPYLEEGIRTFVKFFGGAQAEEAAKIFQELGIETFTTKHAANTEAMKLWDTTQYGALIMLNKEIYEYCKINNLDFDVVYTMANETYNDGYTKIGLPNVVRPYLKHMEGKIGGHCIIPNAALLDSETPKMIIEKNDKLGGEKAGRIFEEKLNLKK